MEKSTDLQLIDMDAVLKSRIPHINKWLPTFVKSYIKKIIHQDEINRFLIKNKEVVGYEFVKNGLDYFNIKRELAGIENLETGGRYIFAANHPLGGMDGMAFIYEMGKYYPQIKTVINDLLKNVEKLNPLFLGVNSYGKNSREHLKEIEETLASESQILMFPAGVVSRRINGVVQDLEWKKAFINWSKKHKRDVFPIHITGRLSNFFYNLYDIRKNIGIKPNIEMFYLSNEMFKQYNKTISITIGQKIPYTTFDNRFTPQQWAQQVRELIYELPQNPQAKLSY